MSEAKLCDRCGKPGFECTCEWEVELEPTEEELAYMERIFFDPTLH